MERVRKVKRILEKIWDLFDQLRAEFAALDELTRMNLLAGFRDEFDQKLNSLEGLYSHFEKSVLGVYGSL